CSHCRLGEKVVAWEKIAFGYGGDSCCFWSVRFLPRLCIAGSHLSGCNASRPWKYWAPLHRNRQRRGHRESRGNWTPQNCSTESPFTPPSRQSPEQMPRQNALCRTVTYSISSCWLACLRQTKQLKNWPKSVRNCPRCFPVWRR